jgi:hypothetical protein
MYLPTYEQLTLKGSQKYHSIDRYPNYYYIQMIQWNLNSQEAYMH